MRGATGLLCCLLVGCQWPKRELTLEAMFITEAAIDWNQSRRIAAVCNEENPFIGPCGNGTPMELYFPMTVALHLAIAALLPPGAIRTAFLGATVGVEGRTIVTNYITGY